MKTLTPAYGRNPRSKKAALADYTSGKDWILNDLFSPWDGKPCSCRNFPNETVRLRYNNLRSVCLAKVEKEL